VALTPRVQQNRGKGTPDHYLWTPRLEHKGKREFLVKVGREPWVSVDGLRGLRKCAALRIGYGGRENAIDRFAYGEIGSAVAINTSSKT